MNVGDVGADASAITGRQGWFTVKRDAVTFDLGAQSIRLRDLSYVDYYYNSGGHMNGAMLVCKDTGDGSPAQARVGAAEAQTIKSLIERFVLRAQR